MPFLEIDNVHKSFKHQVVVQKFDLAVERGEFISFLGSSGCGKTTTLRMVAGFERPTSGIIRINGRDVTGLRPNQRNVGMVFQSYALFPNMTVAENVAFGLKVAGRPEAEITGRIEEMLRLIGLPALGGRYPYQLSGGQQQRVALARALAVKPQVLLLDEPLSALDAKIRVSLREEIRALQRELGITTIYVTHDQEEALSMSDRIVVMNEGRVEQVGTPFEIYNQPRTRFVASFVGTLSFLRAKVLDPVAGRIMVADQEIVAARGIPQAKVGETWSVALRPEAALLEVGTHQPPIPGRNRLVGTIEEVSFLGSVVRIRVRLGELALSLDTFNNPGMPPPERGAPATVTFAAEDLLVLEGAEAA
ncbi:MAG: ABC transporter ATP-binding protein [Geminicoccaceae bacterium]